MHMHVAINCYILFHHFGGMLGEHILTFDVAMSSDVCGERRGWEIGGKVVCVSVLKGERGEGMIWWQGGEERGGGGGEGRAG